MAVNHKKSNTPNNASNQEKLLQQQIDYLHDLTNYALFIKEYVEKQKEKESQPGSAEQVSGGVKQPQSSVTASKDDTNFINSISSLVDAVGKVDTSKFDKNIESLKGITGFINEVVDKLHVGSGEELKGKLAAMDTVSKFATSIVSLGDHILQAAFKMRMARPFVGMITGTINKIVHQLGSKEDVEKAKTAAETVDVIGKSIIGLSWKLILIIPLAIPMAIGLLAFKGLTMLAHKLFKSVAFDTESINKGAVGMSKMGAALIIFAGGIVLAALILGKVAGGSSGGAMAGGLLILFGALALTILLFKWLGKDTSNLAKGALGITVISISLAIFSMALVFSATMLMANPLGVLLTLLTVGAFGALYYFMGKGEAPKNIAFGALAVFAMGISLYFLSKGIVPLANTIAQHPISSTIGIPIAIIALGGAYAAVGAMMDSGFVEMGVLGVAAIGGSLWVLGKGLQALFNLPQVTKELADGWRMGITAVFRGFTDLGIGGTLRLIALTPAIPAILALSAALPMMADGIVKWKSMVGVWTEQDGKSLTTAVGSITQAFHGVTLSDTANGVVATLGLGKSLSELAFGVFEWSSQGKMGKIAQSEYENIRTNIAQTIGVVGGAFSVIGTLNQGGKPSTSYMKMILGDDFSKGNVDEGIHAVGHMSKVLKSLAEGVFEWSNHGKMGKISSAELGNIRTNIAQTIGVVGGAFSVVGQLNQGGKPPTSLWKLVFGDDFSKGNVDEGIHAVGHMSDVLKSLAKGVFEWSNGGVMGKISKTEIGNINKNIAAVLSALPKGFSEIGKNVGTFMKGDMEKGINAVKELTPILTSVSTLVYTFSKMGVGEGKQSAEAIGKDIGLGIQGIYQGISKAFVYTKGVDVQQMSNGLTAMSGSILMLSTNSRQAYAELKRLVDLHDPLANFLKLFTDFSKNLKDQQMSINAIQMQNLVAYSNLIDKLVNLGKLDSNVFKTNLENGLGKKIEPNTYKEKTENKNGEKLSDNLVETNKIVVASNNKIDRAHPQQAVNKTDNKKATVAKDGGEKTPMDSHALLEQIAHALTAIAGMMQQSTPDAMASAIIEKLGHMTTPIPTKEKKSLG